MPTYDPAHWCWHCDRTISITKESMAITMDYGQTCGRCLRELTEARAAPISSRGYKSTGDCAACSKKHLPVYAHEGFDGHVCAHCCLYMPRQLTHCAPCQTCTRRIDETEGAMRHPDGLECLHCAQRRLKADQVPATEGSTPAEFFDANDTAPAPHDGNQMRMF